VAVDVLLYSASDLVDGGGAELDQVEGVEHRDGVLELVIEGVLVAVKRVQGRDLDAVAEGLVTRLKPLGVRGAGPAGHQVQQPRPGHARGVAGQIHHPGQLLGATAAVGDRLGGDVVPHVLIHPERGHALEPGLVAAIASSSGLIERHTVRQVVPSCRASPATDACSRRSCLIAHQHARVVSSALGRARSSCCSVNTPAGHAGSPHRQVRLRHTSRTGRPKHGVSTKTTSRRPWLCAITPQLRQPIGAGADSTTTCTRPRRSATSTTWNPSSPTSRSQRSQ
jgi:hypothetical protein